jgi:hypothetical protein
MCGGVDIEPSQPPREQLGCDVPRVSTARVALPFCPCDVLRRQCLRGSNGRRGLAHPELTESAIDE